MNKKRKYWLLMACFLGICIIAGVVRYVDKTAQSKTVRGFWADYTYYDRKLSVSDFEQFGYDSTWEDVYERLGMPNGTVGTNRSLPYYELQDGRFAVCSFTKKIFVYIANKDNVEYYLLPPELKEKSEPLKEREVENARQYEMNVILGMLGIKDWKPISDGPADKPLGEYTAEKLQQYAVDDNTVDISYYFGSYRESVQLPLIQFVQIYKGQEPICFSYVLWDTVLDWHEWYIEDDAEYLEDRDDHVEIAKKFELKSQKTLLNVSGEDEDLLSVDLMPQSIANSITEYLVKQKMISNRRNSHIEFWGEDGNGKYICLVSANPWKIGWDIETYNRGTKYYFVTMDTLDDAVTSINVVLFKIEKSQQNMLSYI